MIYVDCSIKLGTFLNFAQFEKFHLPSRKHIQYLPIVKPEALLIIKIFLCATDIAFSISISREQENTESYNQVSQLLLRKLSIRSHSGNNF